MKITLIYLLGAATSSSWWAAALWAHHIEMDLTPLWFVPAIFTVITLISAISIAETEA